MRPGCDRSASARVAFDPVALQLWLDPLSLHAAPVQELCEFHVERLTVPRGWTATDRRPGTVMSVVAPVGPIGAVASSSEDSVVEPAAEEPVFEEPAVEQRAVEVPVLEDPVVDEPVVAERVTAEPAVEEPVVEEPAAEEPAVEEPVVEEVAAAAAGRVPSRRRSSRNREQSLLSRAFALSGPQESILTEGRTGAQAPIDPGDRSH